MPHLNRNQPYAEVYGLAPAVYQQNGRYFLRNGELWVDPAEPAPPDPTVDAAVVAAMAPGEPERVGKVAADDMRLAANKALKVQMEAYGEAWQGVEHAKKFLGIA